MAAVAEVSIDAVSTEVARYLDLITTFGLF